MVRVRFIIQLQVIISKVLYDIMVRVGLVFRVQTTKFYAYDLYNMVCARFIIHFQVIIWKESCYLILWSVRVSIPLRSN